ncbi:MAG: GDP-mannose 4,6-dehydratase [Acidobacteriota bacterium]
MTNQPWLVTGGCGFVGSNLTDALLSDGLDVTVLDNLSRHGSPVNLAWLRTRHGRDWRFVEGDVRDGDRLQALLRELRPAIVAHLAGQVAMTTSLADPRLDFEVNAAGTFNLLEAVRRGSPDCRVLYSSTNKVYGALEGVRVEERPTRYVLCDYPDGLDEDLPLDGCSPYGCSKLAAEQYVRDYNRSFGLRTTVFRHSSMYGGRQFATFDQGWIGWFCLKAIEMADPATRPFTISGNGKQVRDALHSDDLVRLYRIAAGDDAAVGRIFNVGGGAVNSLSLIELFAALERLVGAPMRFDRLPWRPGDQRVFVSNNAKAIAALGWTPRVSVGAGLTAMLSWAREVSAGA